MSMQIRSLGVVGAGQMGNGIAQVAAGIGLEVRITDVSSAALDKGMSTIAVSCDQLRRSKTMRCRFHVDPQRKEPNGEIQLGPQNLIVLPKKPLGF